MAALTSVLWMLNAITSRSTVSEGFSPSRAAVFDDPAARSPDTMLRLLKKDGYTMQADRKVLEGDDHPDRDAQFNPPYARVKMPTHPDMRIGSEEVRLPL